MTRVDPARLATFAATLLVLFGAGACADSIVDATEYASVEVEVTRRSGEPVEGADVLLFTGVRPEAEGVTGPDGVVLFEHLVPFEILERGYGVRVRPPEGWTWPETLTSDPVVNFRDGIRPGEGEHQVVSFVLMKRGPGGVEIVVRDLEGAPVPGAELRLFSPLNEHRDTGVTGADGRFLFRDVPFGRYAVRVWAPDGYVTRDGGTQAVVGGALVEEGVTETLELELVADFGSIEVQTRRRSGEPVPGADLVLYTGQGPVEQATTDQEGRHRFERVPSGNYGVRNQPPDGWTWMETLTADPEPRYVDGIAIQSGDERSFTFTYMKVGPGSIEVVVRGPDDEPVPDAELGLYTPFSDYRASAVTGQGGRAVFEEVPFGHYAVRLRAPSGYETEEGGSVAVVEEILVEEDVTETVTFDLRRPSD